MIPGLKSDEVLSFKSFKPFREKGIDHGPFHDNQAVLHKLAYSLIFLWVALFEFMALLLLLWN